MLRTISCERSISLSPGDSSSPFPSVLLLDRFRFRCKFLARGWVLREAASEWHPLISGTVARSRFSIADSTRRATITAVGDGPTFLRVSACSLAACCWLYELKRGILMSAGEGFAKGEGFRPSRFSCPLISTPFFAAWKRKREGGGWRGNHNDSLSRSRKICRFVLIRR